MSYAWSMGAYRCTQIKDANGNYISIAYDTEGRLDTVTDTLGRVVTVNYDGTTGLPGTITQTWKGSNGSGSTATHTWATFAYTTKTVATDFSTSITTIIGPPNSTAVTVLDKITYADGSSTKFDYNGYVQVSKVSSIAADSSTHVLNYVSTNLASPSSSQTDCPRFTHTYTKAENFNMSGGSPQEIDVENLAPASTSFSGPNGSESTSMVKVTMAGHPDGLYTKIHYGPSGWKEGLSLATEDCVSTCTGTDRKRWTWSDWTQDNTGVSYENNPRVKESQVGDPSNTKKTKVYYYEPSTGVFPFGLPAKVEVYDGSTVLKTQTTTYNLSSNYTDRRIIGLPSETKLYEGTDGGSLMSKVTYAYDEDGYGASGQSVSPTQHDSAYGTSFSYRGNLTKTMRWDTNSPTTDSLAVSSSVVYNTAGSAVSQTDPRGRVSSISYTDVWNDSVSRTTYAYPTTVTDPGGFSSTIQYRFDIGANVWARSPTPSGSGNSYGKTTSRTYSDATGRIGKEKIENTGAYTRYSYSNTGTALSSYTTIVDANNDSSINSSDEVPTETLFDGAGRVRMSRTENSNSTGGYTGKLVEYDILGRAKRESVPTEIDSSWNPAGDDYRGGAGWLWNTKEFDWKGRVTRTIPSDSNGSDGKDTLIEYAGCGCAGGQVTTVKGPVTSVIDVAGNPRTTKRRWQKSYDDILGRTFKTEVWDLDGGGSAPYSTTKTIFNGRDQATSVTQYAGGESSSPSQTTTLTYDGHGRVATKHLPEYDTGTTTSWTYNPDDSIATVTDPRAAVTAYKYGHIDEGSGSEYRSLLTKIVFSVPTGSSIPIRRI
ncbi:MAG: hypothetical protein DMF63_04315 [Acidobacteria bacterium]|nr:MAG: hypothetical protein DMF63_04315 [Acidobacteriota bacterium]